MPSLRSLVSVDSAVTIRSGEEFGISKRINSTRSMADKSSFRSAGNGNRVPLSLSDQRRGADPSRNESGMTGKLSFSCETSIRSVNIGNCFVIAADFNSEFETLEMLILHTRSCRSRAAMRFISCDRRELAMSELKSIKIGKAGQISSSFFTGRLVVQRSTRCSQRGDANTTYRHFRHTCTSICHVVQPFRLRSIRTQLSISDQLPTTATCKDPEHLTTNYFMSNYILHNFV